MANAWTPTAHRASGAGQALVVIGNFDGVHLGHQAVLTDAAGEAERRGLEPVVLTFDPHPAEVLGKGDHLRLTDTPRKLKLLRDIDSALTVSVEPFTRQLAALSPEEFVQRLLVDALRARVVLVGDNFRFGRARTGDLGTLRELGLDFAFEARSCALANAGGAVISSSRIRQALLAGEPVLELLGRPHSVSGTVVHGRQLGRTLGFPTANLGATTEMLPALGVYPCFVDLFEGERAVALAAGVANVGVRPTVAPEPDGRAPTPSVEVHLFDTATDLYGQRLRVHFLERLRPETRFADVAALAQQIGRDVAAARLATDVMSRDRVPLARGWF